ncbi:MAG: hypothetical protein WCB03_21975 [Rouxiella badensis]|uniref:hypothetical protein n=1 Tax=Rouxiella badensis TaxID=1646377 RepID=UPI003C69FF3D
MNIQEAISEQEQIKVALQKAFDQSPDQFSEQALDEAPEQNYQIKDFEGKLSINGYIAIPVYAIDSSTLANDDVILKYDGDEIGFLCAVGNSGNVYDINELTLSRLIAYFNDVEREYLLTGTNYNFKCHYVVVKNSHYALYWSDYAPSAPLWGNFSHDRPRSKYQKSLQSIDIIAGMKIPTPRHTSDLARAISSSNGFDRFLKYYHQIELLFDVIFVAKIKALPADSLDGLRDIMKDYQRNELDNLRGIIKEYVRDVSFLTKIIAEAFTPQNIIIMKNIFQNHTKDGNPLFQGEKELWSNFSNFIGSPNPDAAKAKEYNLINKVDSEIYRVFMLKLISYWIYRIRCSIAHNKIGEFIFRDEDEEFVVVLGEGLLKSVIKEMFSNPSLTNLI